MLFLIESPEDLRENADIMREFTQYMNVIPIISKGDHLITDNVALYKQEVNKLSAKFGIDWFNCKMVKFEKLIF